MVEDIQLLCAFILADIHPADLFDCHRSSLPIKDAVDCLFDVYTYDIIAEVFERLGLDKQALSAESHRRQKADHVKQMQTGICKIELMAERRIDIQKIGVNDRSQKDVKADGGVTSCRQDSVERLMTNDIETTNELSNRMNTLLAKGSSLGHLLHDQSENMQKIIEKANIRIIDTMSPGFRLLTHGKDSGRMSFDASPRETRKIHKLPEDLANKFKIQLEANTISRANLQKRRESRIKNGIAVECTKKQIQILDFHPKFNLNRKHRSKLKSLDANESTQRKTFFDTKSTIMKPNGHSGKIRHFRVTSSIDFRDTNSQSLASKITPYENNDLKCIKQANMKTENTDLLRLRQGCTNCYTEGYKLNQGVQVDRISVNQLKTEAEKAFKSEQRKVDQKVPNISDIQLKEFSKLRFNNRCHIKIALLMIAMLKDKRKGIQLIDNNDD